MTTCCFKEATYRPYYLPAATLHLHADSQFTSWERNCIATAAKNLALQSDGLVDVRVDYDLDLLDGKSVDEHQTDDLLFRLSDDSSIPSQWRVDHVGSVLLGLTRYPNGEERGTYVYLVVDELTSKSLFVSVAMHEFLHAVGLAHVSDESALMAAGARIGDPITCMKYADVMELCRVYGCNVQRVGYCEN